MIIMVMSGWFCRFWWHLWRFWRWKPESGGITSCLISGSWELLWNLVVIVIVIAMMILVIFTTIMVMGTSEHMDGAGQRGRWVACLGWTWAGFPPGRHHHYWIWVWSSSHGQLTMLIPMVMSMLMVLTMWAASGVAAWRNSLSGRRAIEPAWSWSRWTCSFAQWCWWWWTCSSLHHNDGDDNDDLVQDWLSIVWAQLLHLASVRKGNGGHYLLNL